MEIIAPRNLDLSIFSREFSGVLFTRTLSPTEMMRWKYPAEIL